MPTALLLAFHPHLTIPSLQRVQSSKSQNSPISNRFSYCWPTVSSPCLWLTLVILTTIDDFHCITQFYLHRQILLIPPAEAGTWFIDHKAMKGEDDKSWSVRISYSRILRNENRAAVGWNWTQDHQVQRPASCHCAIVCISNLDRLAAVFEFADELIFFLKNSSLRRAWFIKSRLQPCQLRVLHHREQGDSCCWMASQWPSEPLYNAGLKFRAAHTAVNGYQCGD